MSCTKQAPPELNKLFSQIISIKRRITHFYLQSVCAKIVEIQRIWSNCCCPTLPLSHFVFRSYVFRFTIACCVYRVTTWVSANSSILFWRKFHASLRVQSRLFFKKHKISPSTVQSRISKTYVLNFGSSYQLLSLLSQFCINNIEKCRQGRPGEPHGDVGQYEFQRLMAPV